MSEQEKGMQSRKSPIIKPENFKPVDIGTCECKTAAVIWESKTDILVTGWEIYTEYGYDRAAPARYADQSNLCLNWIEDKKEYIQKLISEHKFQPECGFLMDGRELLNRALSKKIQMEICVQAEMPPEISACIYIYVKPFFFPSHCHCIEIAVLANEDGTFRAEITENMQRLLSEIHTALKEKNTEACEWAGKNGIFYAFDEEDNMLAVVKQSFCFNDNKWIAKTGDSGGKKKGNWRNTQERNALYLIRPNWNIHSQEGIPLPYGFTPKELLCKNGVFTITSYSAHNAITGTFLVMAEALTMIEMLFCTRGVTEEEIEQCYYTFLVEDHKKYTDRISQEKPG